MKTRYFSLGSVPVLQTTLFQCPAFRTLCTLIFSSFFHPTQSKLISLRPWSRKVNTLQLEARKQKNYAEYKSSLDYFSLPHPCTPHTLPTPRPNAHFYVRSEAQRDQHKGVAPKSRLLFQDGGKY